MRKYRSDESHDEPEARVFEPLKFVIEQQYQ